MKTLLWLGNPFFFPAVKELLAQKKDFGTFWEGPWNAVWRNPAAGDVLTWQDCVALASAEPDIVVVGDTSRPPFVLGVENFPCLTVLYAVDTHIHSWMPWYGQAFDACLISLKDHMEYFRHKILPDDRLCWSPPYARVISKTGSAQHFEQQWDASHRPILCIFAGSLDAETLPVRHHFLTRLGKLVPELRIISDSYTKYYPYARIVVNVCEHGDLNFRVFESLGCGAALVTPAISNGLADIFQSGTHLQSFDMGPFTAPGEQQTPAQICDRAYLGAERAAHSIRKLLRDDAQRVSLARHGWAEVHRAHMAAHRARAFMQHIEDLSAAPMSCVDQRRAKAALIRKTCLKLLYLHWGESLESPAMRAAYIKAARGEL